MANGRDRREPVFETRAEAGSLDDRPLAGGPGRRRHGATSMRQAAAAPATDPHPRRPRGRQGGRGRRSSRRAAGLWRPRARRCGASSRSPGIVAYYASQLPPIDQLAVPKRPPNIAILASDGTLIANRGETGGRTVAPEGAAALPAEGLRRHRGPALLRPFRHRSGRHRPRRLPQHHRRAASTQGGSTLTQQLAKNLFLTQERTASRKIQEAILALWLERKYTKDEILELYLNRVYFGAGAYGVEAAAQRYYGKSARAVSLSEAAVLAGLVQAPSRLAPNRNPDAAQRRAELVIAAMNELGFITAGMTKTALGAPAEAVRPQGAGSVNYAADYVMDVLDDFVGTVESDIVVATTIDPALQAAAERAIVDELDAKGAALQRQPGRLRGDAAGRRAEGAGRRPQLRGEPVQPRDGGAAPAGLGLQALRLSRRAGARAHPRHGARGRPGQLQGLEPGELFPRLSRPGHAARRARPVAQHRRGAARPRGRAEGGRADGAAARHHLAAAGQPLASPSAPRR